MSDHKRYFPPDIFLRMIANGDVPIGDDGLEKKNLDQLIELTSDSHPANRDWATFLLSQADVDTEDVRHALIRASQDVSPDVRAEAFVGLAMRDRETALPLVREALLGTWISKLLFEAAAYVGDPRLCSAIERAMQGLEPGDPDEFHEAALEALSACQNNAPIEPIIDIDD